MADCDNMGTTGKYQMGFAFGLQRDEIKRKFRWLFQLPGISASDDPQNGLFSLPPRRANRPSLSWKEETIQHLTETIYFPFKPDWKTMNLTLFDLDRCERRGRCNVVLDWLRKADPSPSNTDRGVYDPRSGAWRPAVSGGLKRDARLVMIDSCGNPMETWLFKNCYPQSIDWGELEMDINDIVTIDLVIRFDRAYQLCDGITQ